MTPTENRYTRSERKTNGVFYTPDFLADYLAYKLKGYIKLSGNSLTITDPACGDSALLTALIDVLPKKCMVKCIGIDKDINAINNSKSIFKLKNYTNSSADYIIADSIFPFNSNDSKEDWIKLKTQLNIDNGFDVIVSNPPWGVAVSGYNNLDSNFTLAKGQYDIFDIFIEIGLSNLKPNGVYAFILPDSIFNQEQYRLRELLAKKTSIAYIARLGEKLFPDINRACSIVIGYNKKPSRNHMVDCMRITHSHRKDILSSSYSLQEIEKHILHKVPQNRFIDNNDYIWDIDLAEDDTDIMHKFEICSNRYKDIVESTRGAEISKRGIVYQCDKCAKWFPKPKSKVPQCPHCNHKVDIEALLCENIISHTSVNKYKKLKVGEDLYRYHSAECRYIDISKDGINYKDMDIYNGTKILVRKTGVGITASIDYESTITNQVVYILKLLPNLKDYLTLEFVLAVLNSRAMTYFILKKFGEMDWKTHPYITQTILKNLPFPKVDYKSEKSKKHIQDITTLIRQEISERSDKNISNTTDIFIEAIVADLFHLNHSDYIKIFNTLNAAEQLIPIKRLMNCNADIIFNK